ncbi:MAG: hypothetical protein LUC33_00255, partial [Prevotellaceae bacterium]|nr:hypothetical protein [Prevotellaceae bacterium]
MAWGVSYQGSFYSRAGVKWTVQILTDGDEAVTTAESAGDVSGTVPGEVEIGGYISGGNLVGGSADLGG